MTPHEHSASILREVARKHGTRVKHILGPWKERELIAARREAASRIYNEVKPDGQPASFPYVGRVLHRHHTSIMNLLGLIDRKKKEQAVMKTADKETETWAA